MGKSKKILRNFLVPLLLHLFLVGTYAVVDPCNNNAGCMAGSMTAYFLLLFTAPTLLLLIIFSIVQATISSPNYAKYLKINLVLSLVPFVIAAGLMVVLAIAF